MAHRDDILDEIRAERERQVMKYGFDVTHDDQHVHKELGMAAATYASDNEMMWPWKGKGWDYRGMKDSYRRRLVTAGSLILAEIERLDRAAQS